MLSDDAKIIGLLEQIRARGPAAPAFSLVLGGRRYATADFSQAIAHLRLYLDSEVNPGSVVRTAAC